MAKREEHRYFDKEFKLEAVRLMDECKRSVRDLAKGRGGSIATSPLQRFVICSCGQVAIILAAIDFIT